MRRVARILTPLLLALVLAGLAGGAGSAEGPRASGYAALLDEGIEGRIDDPGSRATARGIRAREIAVGEVSVETASAGATVEARADARDVLLLGGRVAIEGLSMTVRSRGDGGAIAASEVRGLRVDGAARDPERGERIEIAGVGALILFEQAPGGEGGVNANALRLEVDDPSAPLPAGSPLVLGHVEIRGGVPPPEPAVTPPSDPVSPPRTTAPPRTSPPPAASPRPRTTKSAPPTVTSPVTLPRRPAPPPVSVPADARYVFPVHGDAGFSDTYGAPRATTTWHHGTDIFAPEGTPLLAVADGTLSLVGVNRLGGNRLWLTDEDGNEFYYAHLSAFAPTAADGRRVRAGEVVGFVGNTGDAITTPPHLHFEIHPGGGDSVNPYPFLLAWQRSAELPLAFRAAAPDLPDAPPAGAVLIGIEPLAPAPADPGDGLATAVG